MRWQTTSSAPCSLSSTTTSSWSQGRAGPARPRPPRKSCNSTLSAVQVPNSWTTSGTGCFSPIRCLRSVIWIHVPKLMLHWTIFREKNDFKIRHLSPFDLYLQGFRKCQNPEEWQLKPLWKIHGHPVRPPGGLKCLHYITLQCKLQYHINIIQQCNDLKVHTKHWLGVKAYLSPSGWCSWWSHPELPAGEVPCGPPEPRREKLSHLLSAGGGRRGRSAPLARPGEKLPALHLPGAGQWKNT